MAVGRPRAVSAGAILASESLPIKVICGAPHNRIESSRGELGFDGDGMFVELHQDINLVVPAVTIPYNLLSFRFESVCSQ